MNFKNTFVLCLLAFFTFSHAESKWNIVLANWVDLSDYKDKSIASMLKSSIYNKLIKEKSFSVQLIGEDISIYSISEANNICVSNKGDIIIYGYYYVEGKSLLVITEVWDTLKKQLKMRNEAWGVISRDIFETLDEISLNVKEKIKEVLPSFTLEEEVEVKKLRETIYEKKEIKIERQFYTKIGFGFDVGEKNVVRYDSTTNYYNNPYPVLYPLIGFMIRYWDIRIDFFGGTMPGWLTYDFVENILTSKSPPNYILLALSYYPPFFNKQWGLGLNLIFVNLPNRIEFEKNGRMILEKENLFPSLPFGFNVFWNPNKSFEFSFNINPFFIHEVDYYKVLFDIPFITFSSAYFVTKEFGIELECAFAKYSFSEGDFKGSEEKIYQKANSTVINFILTFIYRVDYAELKK